mgnify:CR=1 FL=1
MEQIETFDPTVVYAQIVKRDDGYHVIDFDGTEGPVCNKRTSDGYIILSPNKANRKCYRESLAEKQFADGAESIPLYYKATRTITASSHMPNEKLIAYLPEDLQTEYKAIIDRAIAAREADKKKPMTELEKAQAKLAKAQAALAKLMEEQE